MATYSYGPGRTSDKPLSVAELRAKGWLDDSGKRTSTVTPKPGGGETWQSRLNTYKTDTSAGNREIERAKSVWDQKTAAGDTAGADAAHTWANQIRDAMGVSSQYDRDTGARLSTPSASVTRVPSAIVTRVPPETNMPQRSAYGMSKLQDTSQQYSFPYEQLLRDIISQPSAYKAPSESELLTQAQQYADLQVSPLLSAIQSRLGNAQTSYANEKGAIEAAYAGVPARTQSLLDEARRNAMESAIARGMGRSGVVDWQTEKLSTPIMQQAAQSEQEKAARLAAIANTLATTQTEADRQRQEAESRRGTLQGSRLADLRNLAQQMALSADAAKWGQGMNIANLATSSNNAQLQGILSLLPMFLGG